MRHLLDAGRGRRRAWSATGCRARSWSPRTDRAGHAWFAATCAIRRLLERALGEYEITTVFHLAAQTTVGVANRNPVSTLDTNIRGTWTLLEACRRSPTVQQIVVASSDKAYGDQDVLPYTEDDAAAGPASVRRQQVVRGSAGADVREELRPAGRASRAAATSTAAAI